MKHHLCKRGYILSITCPPTTTSFITTTTSARTNLGSCAEPIRSKYGLGGSSRLMRKDLDGPNTQMKIITSYSIPTKCL
ncbi:unnamed protein product [Dovyalis caffra]|uniref:Uncharacterized protein n=1 Tax=Dovyalis caffra TaxID=77055 RepID=A0AAV1SFZ2_9ROSI|nr:unnamed protein product [Dovyalis caffra]